MHIGNIGVVTTKGETSQHGETRKLVRIDFAGSFKKLEKDIHPHSHRRHPAGFGPTNHFREFPRRLKNNQEFVDHAMDVANKDLKGTLGASFNEISKYYGPREIAEWAHHTMPDNFKDPNKLIKQGKQLSTNDDIQKAFVERLEERQKSLKEFALEIQLGLLVTQKDKKFEITEENKVKLKNVIQENPEYFKQIAAGKKKIHLRDKDKKAKFFGLVGGCEKMLKKHITAMIKEMENDKPKTRQISHRQSTDHNTVKTQNIDITTTEMQALRRSINNDIPSADSNVIDANSASTILKQAVVRENTKQKNDNPNDMHHELAQYIVTPPESLKQGDALDPATIGSNITSQKNITAQDAHNTIATKTIDEKKPSGLLRDNGATKMSF